MSLASTARLLLSPVPCSLLSEATQCDSGPEIGTRARINPRRRPVIKQPGMFSYTLTGGERRREKDKETQRHRDTEVEQQRNPQLHRPDTKQFREEGRQELLSLQFWPEKRILPACVCVCGHCEGRAVIGREISSFL